MSTFVRKKTFFIILFFSSVFNSNAQNCTNWLKVLNNGSFHDGVTIGDLDVTGDQLTVEATFNSTATTATTSYNAALVSKHSTPADCNFVLRTDMAQLSTQSNGLVSIISPCTMVTNKTYHVAMVYDGSTLKFYSNGFLMVSAPQHGNMITNNLLAFIGNKAGGPTTEGTRGIINEVRIWNLARTQSQIRTYMNVSLPNPTSQTGLLAYYTFDNLLNKQGNPAWNGTLVGSSSINSTNTNCTIIADSCGIIPPTTACNNWLYTPSNPSYVGIGDLDVPGNQITVEANINSTGVNPGGRLYAGDIVSKHTGPNNTNYLLRPNSAEITTSNGYFITPVICNVNLNQTYHVAMVYDGLTLKFYRDGFLMSQIAATGNLFQNDLNTRVGLFDAILPTSEQFLGYINEVRIWNIARTQSQIKTYMNTSLPNPTLQTGLLAYYTFDNLLNKQGNKAWNATLSGSALTSATNPNCSFVADSCSVTPINSACNFDFTFKQDVCNPLSVQFFNEGTIPTAPYWSFGDGTFSSGNLNPIHTFQSFGNYTIKYSQGNSTCTDTLPKAMTVNLIQDDVILTKDTTICFGSSKQLMTKPSLDFCWSPTISLINPNSPNPITTTTNDIKYYINTKITGNNLIVNGDFSAGNSGFTSDYKYANPNITEGQYFVGPNPNAWNPTMNNCTDHTTGTGNMLLVNGAPAIDVEVWKETIAITPNTNYAFSTSVQALWDPNPAQLRFSINGINVGTLITASLPTCTWASFYTTWNSGNNTTATISLVNKNTFVLGNDFALDDIVFAPVYIKTDSVSISVERPKITASNDTSICFGNSFQLNAVGGVGYKWSPTIGLSNTNIANPIATPTTSTQYIVTGTTAAGCTAKDSVNVLIKQSPIITKTNDTTVCHDKSIQLFASGGNIYSWLPTTGLSNANVPNPIATPTANTIYYISVTGTNFCQTKDSIKLTIRPIPTFSISPSTALCFGNPKQLNASGGDTYTWFPSSSLSNPNIANPIATLQNTTTYQLKIISSACNDIDTLSTTISILPKPILNVSSANDIDCAIGQSQLTVNGASNYIWSPTNGLNNATIYNPIASPTLTTTYTVTGVDANGCTDSSSVVVNVSQNGKSGYEMPNAFTPNNDGLNDCFGIKYWGQVNSLQFSIYDRFGKRLFFTENPSGCWDGTYDGQQQPNGNYIYYIKAITVCGTAERKGSVLLIR